MEMVHVHSSMIQEVGYNPVDSILAVRFNGGKLFHYEGVPRELYEGVLQSESIGKYFNQHVRGQYGGLQVREETDDA